MPNAYMEFVKAKRSEVVAAHPGWGIAEIGKKLGEMWRGLSEAEKSNFKAKAAAAPKAAKKIVAAAEKPKRKLNPYMNFVKKNRAAVVAGMKSASISDIGKKLGQMWRSLSDSEKKKYA